ncbi:hypothetical protein Cpir12675_001684 [Ceratocystis pirilliformis]|uniref:Uncharacterized protein n=1 Tax=Ceratocystis pirilliformis TaxID=259994 RepID=A0ABR3ZFF2_9PEZI
MGLNAYFAFQVVGPNGSGSIPYSLALTAVFVEGLIFVVLALTGMRQWLVRLIPATIKTATGVGIGLFLTEIGLSYAAGIGAITGGWKSTPLALGGCAPELIDSQTQMCSSGLMSNPKMWVGIVAGGILTAFLMSFRVKYALIIGIAFVSLLSWPRNTAITYFPHTDEGNSRYEFFKNVVSFRPIKHTLAQLDWDFGTNGSQFALALFTFLYVDIIDATATLYSMVGCMMIRQITQINWKYIGDILPSFVVMTFIPFSYSVAYGLIAGVFVYTALNSMIAVAVWASGGRLEPREYDMKEYWTWKGMGRQPWFVRAVRNRGRFWYDQDDPTKQGYNLEEDHDHGRRSFFETPPPAQPGERDKDGIAVQMPERAFTTRR